jgi:hypothetical protein
MKPVRSNLLSLALAAIVGAAAVPAACAADAAQTVYSATTLKWSPQVAYDGVTLRVVNANGYLFERDFGAGQPSFSIIQGGAPLPDGQYKFELTFAVMPDAGAGQTAGSTGGQEGRTSSAGQSGTTETYSGSFVVSKGQILDPQASEGGIGALAQVIAQDLITQGSLCVGIDCTSTESFGFDTIRLKENNLRIKFDDTSTSAGFPSTDWQLTANDSASGGQNKFSIEDITSARVPFTVEGGATTNSIYVDSTGRVGFRTSTPVLDLHVATSNTPALRLEQNNSGGFTAQTWDVAGNEANFFVRDVTTGSKLPFRIRPGAPTSSLDIAASGNVGIGTGAPDSTVHIKKTDGTAKFKIEEASGTNAERNQFVMINNGNTRLRMDNGTSGWLLTSKPTDFTMGVSGGTTAFDLTSAGNLTIAGTLTQGSSRDIKENISLTDAGALLSKVASLPLYTWNYKQTPASQRHVGPIAEEFYDVFRLGPDNKHVAPSDVAGVALGAVQALNGLVAEKDAEIQALKARLLKLEGLLGLIPGDKR